MPLTSKIVMRATCALSIIVENIAQGLIYFIFLHATGLKWWQGQKKWLEKKKKNCCNPNNVHMNMSSLHHLHYIQYLCAHQGWLPVVIEWLMTCKIWHHASGQLFKHCTSEVTGLLMTSLGSRPDLLLCSPESPRSPSACPSTLSHRFFACYP